MPPPQTSPDVSLHPARHTLLPLPQPLLVPGSRFRELYYWDSYWVLRGALVAGRRAAARGLVANLLHLLDCHGHVPNGSRCYYLNRRWGPGSSSTSSSMGRWCGGAV